MYHGLTSPGRWLSWLGVVLGAGIAQAQFQPGTTNKIFAEGDTGVSYLAYFPTSYNTNNPPPLMLYFDPAAWAEFGMEKLQPSCEAAGWILVCPYVLSNTAVTNENVVESEIIWDVKKRIPHNRKRLYLAGLSGGAWRANFLAHELPGEFAGVLGFGGWIGWYDDVNRYPDRLAVCTVNGVNDPDKIEQEPVDDWYYTQTLVRVNHIYWHGGHDISVPGTIDVAIAWFNADYAATGFSFVSSSADLLASNCYLQATSAVAAGQYTTAATNAVEILYRYPESGLTRAADNLIISLFGNDTTLAQIDLTYMPADAMEISHVLMQRGTHYQDHFPRHYGKAFHEAALIYNPTNVRAMTELAVVLLDDVEWRHTLAARTRQLLTDAIQLSPNDHYVRDIFGKFEAQYGNAQQALAYGDQARTLYLNSIHYLLNNSYTWPLYYIDQRRNDYSRRLSEYWKIPYVDNLQFFSPGIPLVNRDGWHLTAGSGAYDSGKTVNGCGSLCLSGADPGAAIKGFRPVTNAVVWTDFYMIPDLSGPAWSTNVLPYETSTWRLDSAGLLHLYDGDTATWLSPAHTPLATSAWSRLTIREDYAAGTWDLSLNDQLLTNGLGFAFSTSVFTRVHIPRSGVNCTRIDSLTVSTNAPQADADRDGMGDTWETANGLNPASALDEGLDPDGDFFVNWEEYRNGTLPAVSNLPPHVGYTNITVAGSFNQWDWSAGNLARVSDTCRHTRWSGDLVVATTSRVEFLFGSELSAFEDTWGADDPVTGIGLPFSFLTVRWSSSSSAENLGIEGPVNGLVRFWVDVLSGETGAEFLGLNDADGDHIADEWELEMSGSATGVDPYANQDGDAFVAIDEYFSARSPLTYDPYSHYSSIVMPASWNGWVTDSTRMTLVADHVWQYIRYFSTGNSAQYKFAANGNWVTNWGDNNAGASYPPYIGVAERDGANISINATTTDFVIIHFDDRTARYSLTRGSEDIDWDGLPDTWETTQFGAWWMQNGTGNSDTDRYSNIREYLNGANPNSWDGWATDYTSMTIAGTFNGWNQAANNMTLVSNNLWRYEATFTNLPSAQFKVAANGTWTTAWGDPSPISTTIPLRGKGVVTPGSPDISVLENLSGTYRFTFHEPSARYSLDYAPNYILMKSASTSAVTSSGMVLRWLSSSDCRYSIGFFSNLNASASIIASNIPATPPMNTWTQTLPSTTGTFFIRRDP